MLLGMSYLEFEYNQDVPLAKYYIKEALKSNPMFEKGWMVSNLYELNNQR